MIAYLLQVAALIAVGWLLYTALLRRETFFSVNRFLLLLLLLIAFTAPLLIIPRQFSVRAFFQKEIPLLTTYRSAVVSSNPLKNVSKQGGEEDLSVHFVGYPVAWASRPCAWPGRPCYEICRLFSCPARQTPLWRRLSVERSALCVRAAL